MGEGVRVRSPVADDGAVTDLDGLDRVHDLLAELQDAVREKDLSASPPTWTATPRAPTWRESSTSRVT